MYTNNIKSLLLEAINRGDKTGFTIAIKGDIKRYVVGLTNNTEYNLITLMSQVGEHMPDHANINVGGWKDTKEGKIYVDISTSCDDLKHALLVAGYNKQLAIWDMQEGKEIRL